MKQNISEYRIAMQANKINNSTEIQSCNPAVLKAWLPFWLCDTQSRARAHPVIHLDTEKKNPPVIHSHYCFWIAALRVMIFIRINFCHDFNMPEGLPLI